MFMLYTFKSDLTIADFFIKQIKANSGSLVLAQGPIWTNGFIILYSLQKLDILFLSNWISTLVHALGLTEANFSLIWPTLNNF